MTMIVERLKSKAAFTLVEVMVAILVMSLAVLGASGYRYYAALDARKAAMHTAGARIALLLCESWRGVDGVETYDPTTYLKTDLPITAGEGPAAPEGFTVLGNYKVALNDTNYYATLSWRDEGAGLRALNVIVAWAQRNQGATSVADTDKSFTLTTYALN